MGHSGYTHTDSRCSSAHLERGEINHTLQKDESPGAVSPSKLGRHGGSQGGRQGGIMLQRWRERQQQNVKIKTKKKRWLKGFPPLMVGFVLRLQPAGGKASACWSRACRRP